MQARNQILISCVLILIIIGYCPAEAPKPLEQCNVVWKTASTGSQGSMPLGNGDISLNVWVEQDGDLLFYIGKTDAWSENGRLLKLGRVRVRLSPNPFQKGLPFKQELRLYDGEIQINAGQADKAVTLHIRVDANLPVIYVEGESRSPYKVKVDLELWRTSRRELTGPESRSAYGLADGPNPIIVEPDVVPAGQANCVVWYHRNERSIWPCVLKYQALGHMVNDSDDPLLNRTFGGAVKGTNLIKLSDTSLQSGQPSKSFRIAVYPHTEKTQTAKKWIEHLNTQISRIENNDKQQCLKAHKQWWHQFWGRSYIYITGSKDAFAVTQGYTLQRYINACGGRGAYPIKFNGSIFTVDTSGAAVKSKYRNLDADFRNWGGCYWWQNTRLPYWAMLTSGDFDLMQPLFQMYLDTLENAKERTRAYYNHEGAFYPETMYFWGTYNNRNYGWKRAGIAKGLTTNQYIRYEWQGGIELAAMMLDYYDLTQDVKFAAEKLIPLAEQIIIFNDKHYARDTNGKIRFEPAQALETYWDSVNPIPEIAGLQFVLGKLLKLPDNLTTDEQRSTWRRVLHELPPLPTRQLEGVTVFSPAEIIGTKRNKENPELYPVFPYRISGLGKDNLGLGRNTYAHRVFKETGGWNQDAIQAAMLGLTDAARKDVVYNFTHKHTGSRFPAFWGPNHDWIPDQDHGAVTMIALQRMLLQTEGKKIFLLPAWPKDWNVKFKVHAPCNTTIEGIYQNGKLKQVETKPSSRSKNIIL